MKNGWIYILSNPSMPGLVKIGETADDPHVRAISLYSTGVPDPFKVEYIAFVNDYVNLEREIHHSLYEYRKSKKESFSP